MQILVSHIKVLVKLVFSSVIAVFLLCCFCYIYTYSGVHITNETGATDYKWEPNQWKATMTEGFAWFHMDGKGFNNANEKALQAHGRPDVLLMGSSHMEAVSLEPTDNAGYLLNEMLPDLATYNIGVSGHTLVHCVNNMEDAVSQYHPSAYVVLETSRIDPDVDEMQMVLDKSYPKIPSYDSGLLYILQVKIPAVKAVYKSIQDWVGCSSMEGVGNASESGSGVDSAGSAGSVGVSDSYRETLSEFLRIAGEAVSDSGARLVIFYHPESGIGRDGQIISTTDPEALKAFGQACEGHGILFVDMTEPFSRLYEEEHILAHGFTNSGVGSGHLNRHGNRVVAETLSEVIKADMGGIGDVPQ